MTNLFFDIIPHEIRTHILRIRLYNVLAKLYYTRVAQKLSLALIVLKLQHKHFHYPYHLYFNPHNSQLSFIATKCSYIITSYDDKIWWLSQLIRPIESGLLHFHHFPTLTHSPIHFTRTLLAFRKLSHTFNITTLHIPF